MSYELHIGRDGSLSLSITDQSIERALAQAREVVPDIDERWAAFAGDFRAGDADPGVPGGHDPAPDPEVREPGPQAADGPAGGERQEGVGTEEKEVEHNCAICGRDTTPDYAQLQLTQHGEVRCPTHGTLP